MIPSDEQTKELLEQIIRPAGEFGHGAARLELELQRHWKVSRKLDETPEGEMLAACVYLAGKHWWMREKRRLHKGREHLSTFCEALSTAHRFRMGLGPVAAGA